MGSQAGAPHLRPENDGVAERLRRSLERSRREGLGFEEAWARAIGAEGRLPRLWRTRAGGESPLSFARRQFRAAYGAR